MDAAYVFRVRLRLDPRAEGVRLDPATFETTMERAAEPPGEAGWLFFRDNLWRGAVNEPEHARNLAREALIGGTSRRRPTGEDEPVTVDSVEFRELRTDREYLDALEGAIANELATGRGTFGNADGVEAVLRNYLGSSIHVRPGPDDGGAGSEST
jgi:hypothetical protein